MQYFHPRPRHRHPYAPPAHLALLLKAAAVVAAQGSRRVPPHLVPDPAEVEEGQEPPPAPAPEWVAHFPEVERLRAACRAASADPDLLGRIARMRLGPHGVTLLHHAAFMGHEARAHALMLHHLHPIYGDPALVDAEDVPKYRGGTPVTPLCCALAGGGSGACMDLLLFHGASPDKALEGLAYGRLKVQPQRARECSVLVTRLLDLVSPAYSDFTGISLGIKLRSVDIIERCTKRLVEKGPLEDIRDGIGEFLSDFSDGGARDRRLLRAFTKHVPETFFCSLVQTFAATDDEESLSSLLHTPTALLPANRATALWAAAFTGDCERVKALFDPGLAIATVYWQSEELTPLAVATQRGHCEVVVFLLDNQTPAQSSFDEQLEAAVEAA